MIHWLYLRTLHLLTVWEFSKSWAAAFSRWCVSKKLRTIAYSQRWGAFELPSLLCIWRSLLYKPGSGGLKRKYLYLKQHGSLILEILKLGLQDCSHFRMWSLPWSLSADGLDYEAQNSRVLHIHSGRGHVEEEDVQEKAMKSFICLRCR